VLRLVGFFVACVVVLHLLSYVPFVGGLFHSLIGFWVAAIVVAGAASWLAEHGLQSRKLRHSIVALGHVETPHNQGKLGSLLASHGRFARALPHLERAAAGEPEVAEWHHRRGMALLALRRTGEALDALRRAAALDAEHAYGATQLGLARAHATLGDGEASLAALDIFERNHGPSPESAYWRALAHKRAGRRDEAARSLREVSRLAAEAARFQRKRQRIWVLRSWLARLV